MPLAHVLTSGVCVAALFLPTHGALAHSFVSSSTISTSTHPTPASSTATYAVSTAMLANADILPHCATLAVQPSSMSASLSDWEQRYASLITHRARCAHSVAFLAALGSAELHSGRLDAALVTLEGVLLRDPLQGGAQVDYAQALFLSGQPFAALDLNQRLREHGDLPDGLADLLRARQDRWQDSLSSWRFRAGVSAGYDTNINAAPNIENATLTLPDLTVELPLAASAQAQSSMTQLFTLNSHYSRTLPDEGHRDVRLGTTYRATEGDYDSWQSNARWDETRTHEAHQLRWSSQVQYLRYNGEPLFQSVSGEVRWQPNAPTQRCWPHVNASLEYQHFPTDRTLNGLDAALGPSLQCRLGQTLVALNTQYLTQLATDSDRVGGDRFGWRAGLRAAHPVSRGALSGQIEALHLDDESGYSPLLGDNTRRRIERYQAHLGYQYPLSDSLTLNASGFYREQNSSINLFEFSGAQYQIGLQWRF